MTFLQNHSTESCSKGHWKGRQALGLVLCAVAYMNTAEMEPFGRCETNGAQQGESSPGRTSEDAWFFLYVGITEIPPLKYAHG